MCEFMLHRSPATIGYLALSNGTTKPSLTGIASSNHKAGASSESAPVSQQAGASLHFTYVCM
jgi:hypothetical protein